MTDQAAVEHISSHHTALMEVVKSAPPVAATSALFLGFPLHDWMIILTIVWLACQIGGWVWDRFFKEAK